MRRDLVINDLGRQCSKCDTFKTWNDYTKNAHGINNKSCICKTCQKAYRSTKYAEDPERYRSLQRAYSRIPGRKLKERLIRYGISRDMYDNMYALGCEICGKHFISTKDAHMDHDHATGLFRGLLCSWCNHGIGQFKDDPIRLRSAADYLEKRCKIKSA